MTPDIDDLKHGEDVALFLRLFVAALGGVAADPDACVYNASISAKIAAEFTAHGMKILSLEVPTPEDIQRHVYGMTLKERAALREAFAR